MNTNNKPIESDYVARAGGCCKECEIYLDYKDSCQCNDGECPCHTPPLHPKDNEERQNIRTSLTYCLPSGITDSEWEVIINNVQSLLSKARTQTKEEMIEIIKGNIIDINDPQNIAASAVNGEQSEWYIKGRNDALDDLLDKLSE